MARSPGAPPREYIDNSRLTAFIARHGLRDYDHLLQRSIADPEWFWPAVLDDLGIEFYEPYHAVLDTSRGIAWARWCVGGRLNIVHNCLDKWVGTADRAQATALRWEGEEGATRTVTYGELCARRQPLRERAARRSVSARATALRCSCRCVPS